MKFLILIFIWMDLLAQSNLKPYSTDGKLLQVTMSNIGRMDLYKKVLVGKIEKSYYKTGELHLEYVKISEEKVLLKEYYKSGQIYITSEYTSDIRNGIAKVYYIDGTLAASVLYKANKMNGTYDEYYKTGKLHYQKYFLDDNLDGPIIEYDIEGNKTYKLDYTNATEVCY